MKVYVPMTWPTCSDQQMPQNEGANCQADGQEPTPSADVTIRTVNLYGLSAASEIQTGKENLKRKRKTVLYCYSDGRGQELYRVIITSSSFIFQLIRRSQSRYFVAHRNWLQCSSSGGAAL